MKKRLGLLMFAICVVAGFLFTSCEKEAKWDFKADGSYVIKDNCNNTKAGTWKLADDGKTLTLDNITAYKVIENSIINLVIEMQVGDVGLVRWTFK